MEPANIALGVGDDGRCYRRLYYCYTNRSQSVQYEVLVPFKDGSNGPFDYKKMGKNPDGPSPKDSYEVSIIQEARLSGDSTFNVIAEWKLGDREQRFVTVTPCKLGVKKLVPLILSRILDKNSKPRRIDDMELHRFIVNFCSNSLKRKHERSKSVVDSKKSKQ